MGGAVRVLTLGAGAEAVGLVQELRAQLETLNSGASGLSAQRPSPAAAPGGLAWAGVDRAAPGPAAHLDTPSVVLRLPRSLSGSPGRQWAACQPGVARVPGRVVLTCQHGGGQGSGRVVLTCQPGGARGPGWVVLTFLSPDSCPGEAGGAPQCPDVVFYRVPGLRPGDPELATLSRNLTWFCLLCHLRGLVFHSMHPALLAAVRYYQSKQVSAPGFLASGPCPSSLHLSRVPGLPAWKGEDYQDASAAEHKPQRKLPT